MWWHWASRRFLLPLHAIIISQAHALAAKVMASTVGPCVALVDLGLLLPAEPIAFILHHETWLLVITAVAIFRRLILQSKVASIRVLVTCDLRELWRESDLIPILLDCRLSCPFLPIIDNSCPILHLVHLMEHVHFVCIIILKEELVITLLPDLGNG